MFIDTAKIHIAAGRGGDGAVAFHREKYIAAGGPDGGDGGQGGSIIFQADKNLSTLMDFRYQRKYQAESGAPGSGRNRSGKDGADLIIRVPFGTVIRHAQSGAVIKDMSDAEPFLIAKGGRGGWGNQHFATPTRQAPRFAKPGLPGDALDIELELKLLADVGLIGFPNVGKSTLLSVISAARPKIADYHFTTLIPNLGVVRVDNGVSFVAADIPGLIEGASQGVGLGYNFLRHIERCRLFIHVVDAAGSEQRDPIQDYMTINQELAQYSSELAKRPQIIAANKCDISDGTALSGLKKYAAEHDIYLVEISAVTHKGVDELIRAVANMLSALPPVEVFQSDYVPEDLENSEEAVDFVIERKDDLWIISGQRLARIVSGVNFADYESRMYFDRVLRKAGLFEKLEEMGISEGDTVSIYDIEFDYMP